MTSKYNDREIMDRRKFLLKTAGAGSLALGAGLWGWLFYENTPVRKREEKIFTLKDYRIENSTAYNKLAIVRGNDAEKMVRAAVHKLGGISRFVTPGERVLIKPNVAWDRQPEQAANTNPEIVASVVKLCREAGAGDVWVTDVSFNDPVRSFSRSGIKKSVETAGGTIKYAGNGDFVSTDLGGDILKVRPVCSFYHEVDKVINIPVVKNHSLSKCTIAMKNWYGVLGGQRNMLHQEIDKSIVDLAAALKPSLTIVDAVRVLVRNGPTGGSLSDVSVENTIVAGLDQVALDSYCLRFLNLSVDEVPYIKMAEQRGLGFSDWKSLHYEELSV